MKILVVDDDPQIRRALALNLGVRDYEVFEAASGEEALLSAASVRPDVVLLDLGLGGADGQVVIEGLRGWTHVPIVVLTARDDERSKVAALDAGADDYVTKPFGMAELLARIRAVTRRAVGGDDHPAASSFETPAFRLDLAARVATRLPSGQVTRLTPIEWAIVSYLARNHDRLVTQQQLLEAVWGPNYVSDPSLLRVHMGHLRQKLEPDPARPRYLLTEPGMGYRLGGPADR